VAASEAATRFSLDEVVFVPTGQPWQKPDADVSPAEHRYLMTVIATASNPRFTVSRVDLERPGPTYTIETLRDLRAQRGAGVDLFFITGADALAQILTWKNSDELFELAHFIGVTRPGHDLSGDGLPADRVSLLEVPAMAISSTAVRERVRAGEPVWYLVPDGVVQYIGKYSLYRASAASRVPGDLAVG
jgi:nicotinate-nucleotide adenylyltransferase